MTKKKAELSDNNGFCERCNDPKTKGQPQSTIAVYLGGGLGWGKMWVCSECYEKHYFKDEASS